MTVKICIHETVPDDKIGFSVIMAKYEGKWIFGRRFDRETWEIPGGHREEGENTEDCARRELYEETGAVDFTLKKITDYSCTNNGVTTYGALFYAEVKRLDKLPNFEITEILLSDCLPDKLTYPDIQPELYEHTQGWLNLMSSPDELWDVYDADRNLKGRLHKRGEALDEGDYHLTVQVFVRRSDGQFLLTKRSPNKGFAGMWECTGGSAVAGDDSLSAAVREVREETGLELDRAKGKLILSRRYTDTFVDNWLFEHEFELSDVKLLEGETCDAMLADKDTILELVKNEHFIPAEWIYDFFTFAEI